VGGGRVAALGHGVGGFGREGLVGAGNSW